MRVAYCENWSNRGFKVGDELLLYASISEPIVTFSDAGEATITPPVEPLRRFISHIVRGPLFGIPEGYVMLSLASEPIAKLAERPL